MRKLAAMLILMLSLSASMASEIQVVGGRPKGCPYRFCMCVVSLEVFGKIIPGLNLAANWPRMFNSASPAPGMVAARKGGGHGFLLKSHVEGKMWRVLDGNTGNRKIGRHKVIIHVRSISGYHIVDPHSPKRRLAEN